MLEAVLCLLGIALCVIGIVALQLVTLIRAVRLKDMKGVFLASFSLLLTASVIYLIHLANRLHGC